MEYSNPNFLICTFFGVSKIFKKFPGTIGSLIGIPVAYFINSLSSALLTKTPLEAFDSYLLHFMMPLFLVSILFLVGVYASKQYIAACGKSDPGEIIIDEIASQTLCILVTLPMTFALIYDNLAEKIVLYYDIVFLLSIFMNVALFRFFDIFKPWPIRYFDQTLKGGFGVMFDDLLAAIFSIVVYFAILFVIIDFYK